VAVFVVANGDGLIRSLASVENVSVVAVDVGRRKPSVRSLAAVWTAVVTATATDVAPKALGPVDSIHRNRDRARRGDPESPRPGRGR
jgi:hypothetical protein